MILLWSRRLFLILKLLLLLCSIIYLFTDLFYNTVINFKENFMNLTADLFDKVSPEESLRLCSNREIETRCKSIQTRIH